MIRIQQLKLQPGHSGKALYEKAAKILQVRTDKIRRLEVRRQSVDARKKPDIRLIYMVDVSLDGISEEKCVARCKNKDVSVVHEKPYRFSDCGSLALPSRPVVIGAGPAGLFCSYLLAACGYRPILLERGKAAGERQKDVEAFWNGGPLDPESNVSFGEGGAGTFSDGKLNTLVKDRDGRGRKVLSVLVEHGAQPEILYEAKPHIGTDVLTGVVSRMRKSIERMGGEVRFGVRVDGLRTKEGRLTGLRLSDGTVLPTQLAVLACGHSARDTFERLLRDGLFMEPKAFAVGLRVEHPQALINRAQYGAEKMEGLPPAPYKVTARARDGRGVYSFCMCPGGYVVNASTEQGRLAVNGMSYSGRDGDNANSAVIVTVTPEDFGAEGALSGVAFQRRLEEKAFAAGAGQIPVQRYGTVSPEATAGRIPADFAPAIKGSWRFADAVGILPEKLQAAFVDGMEQFGHMIPGFDDENALVCGVESRTSSPVRIRRNEELEANIAGLYPCGEGAGYAGGITSAAMDGMRVAEAIAVKYAPFEDAEREGTDR
ncbi:MAG: FAD-dependent oxidoreductase [Eubacteriales bacterium]|nr:FAD-dependent oxidoreductase [Eubacteriales bacterium]